ncbi:esterase/lipase family protein [Archangium lansingense]|uniref:esterase/lipase family protein n=1 Tax=Archangium lansingense TaxID=2995310 RepID=UPI003B81A875
MSPPEENKAEIQWHQLFKPMKGMKQGAKNQLVVARETIPIVFVPGIMGTRLKNSKGEKVWDPDDALFMLRKYGLAWRDAEDKKEMVVGKKFNENFLETYLDDEDHNEDKLEDFPGADERGWGGVSWSSYGAILTALHTQKWSPLARLCFKMPVYAFGYNWTGSNTTAGKKLKAFIDDIVEKNACEHVIIVTHSMGGLVTRSACIEHGANAKVLGIVHGVQPVTGAAAAYWRMKAGFERTNLMSIPAAWVLGTNGEEVTALLANMPGGMQLLPSHHYTANDGSKQWLQFEDHTGKQMAALPKSGDPYAEIYKEQKQYWRLVNPAFLAPGEDEDSPTSAKTHWAGYTQLVDKTKAFHDRVGLSPNAETSVFYGSGKEHLTADRVLYKLSPNGFMKKAGEFFRVIWTWEMAAAIAGGWGAAVYLGYEAITSTDWWKSRGGFEAEITLNDAKLLVTLQPPDGAGDGTVPESSGKGLKNDATGVPKIAHEPAYQDKVATDFTLQAIEKYIRGKVKKRIQG